MNETDSIIARTFGNVSQALPRVVGSSSEDPEKAARALQLQDATGVPAEAIYEDPEAIEAQHKALLASEIIRQNVHLQDYVASNPMHAKVSNDDWHNLDQLTGHVKKLSPYERGVQFLKGRGAAQQAFSEASGSVLESAVKGAKESFGEAPVGAAWIGPEFAKNYPTSAAELATLATIPDLAMRLFTAGLGGLGAGATALHQQLGLGNETESRKFGADIAEMTGQQLMGLGAHKPMLKLPPGMKMQVPDVGPVIEKALSETVTAINAARPWVEAGEEPPAGIHPLIDQAKISQAKLDAETLKQAEQVVAASTTGARAPGALETLLRSVSDHEIGISAEGVRRLYGEEEPSLEDGKLGWVPNIVSQLRTAEAIGGDIRVPFADWLTKGQEVAKELHDDLRLRRGGLTLNETKEMEAPRPFEAMAEADPNVQAIRNAAGLEVPRGEVIQHGKTEFQLPTATDLTPENLARIDHINSTLERLIPRLADVAPAKEIKIEGKNVSGVYQPFTHRLPLIAYLIDNPEALKTGRHEAIHHLRQAGFFNDSEWSLLEKTALKEDWIGKHGIDTRYRDQPIETRLEESIADEFKHWRKNPGQDHIAKQIFEKLLNLIQQFKSLLREFLGHEPTAEDIFLKVEKGEVGARRGVEPIRGEAFRHPLAEELPPWEVEARGYAQSVNMSKRDTEAYIRLMRRRHDDDAQRQVRKVERDIRRRQTKEWKDAEAKVRDEVAQDVADRPDVAADEFFRSGRLMNEKVGDPRLGSEFLTPQQRSMLHKDTYAKGGYNPDDIAGLFGYHSGEAMINRMGLLEQARKAQRMDPREYLKALVDDEVERRMRAEHGDLDENILREAQDHVISPTQEDILSKELETYAKNAGLPPPRSKAEVKAWVREQFSVAQVGAYTKDSLLAAAGKAGLAVEAALKKGDAFGAFRAKQQQQMAMLFAAEAKKLDKEKATFAKNAKAYGQREVKAIEPEYHNWIHSILVQVGQPIRRSMQDLAEAIAREGSKTLQDFYEDKTVGDLRVMPIAEFLMNPAFKKPISQMTVAEFRAVNDSIKTLIKNGRDERTLEREGEKRDRDEIMKTIVETVKEHERDVPLTGTQTKIERLKYIFSTGWASHLQLESVFNRIAKGDTKHPLYQWVFRPLVEGANYEAKLERDFARRFRDIKAKGKDLRQQIDTIFKDPFSRTDPDDPTSAQRPLANFTRENLRAVMLYAGSKTGLDKLARGFGLSPEAVLNFINTKATEKDWAHVESLWSIFADAKKLADRMNQEIGGVPAENLELNPIQTPFGTKAGGYYRINYDQRFKGTSKRLLGENVLEQEMFAGAITPHSWEKQRTGYAAPLDLSLSITPVILKQMLHDIALRPAVINASKAFRDQKFRNSLTQHYGQAYSEMLMPFLKAVANSQNYMSPAERVGMTLIGALRQNIVGNLIGFNPYTVLKHGTTAAWQSAQEVGPLNFARELTTLLSKDLNTTESNWRFALDKSEELGRRHQHFNETIYGANQSLWTRSWRSTMMQMGSAPVAFFDLLSAVPTWLAQYKKSIEAGETEGSAIDLGNRAVRRAHGSSAITSRPAVARGNPIAQQFTSIYTFFNHILNRQYETAWRAQEGAKDIGSGRYNEGLKQFTNNVLPGIISYFVVPVIVEEMFSPMTNEEHESWGHKSFRYVSRSLGGGIVGLRDLLYGIESGHESQVGILTAAAKDVGNLAKDLKHGSAAFDKYHRGALIHHTTSVFGAATGLTNAHEGRLAEGIHDYIYGVAKPKNAGDWWSLMTTGHIPKKGEAPVHHFLRRLEGR